MNKPYQYTIIDNKSGDVVNETNYEPHLHQLKTWETTEKPNELVLLQTKTAYIDTRYPAKLRLYNYVTYTRNGLPIPTYKPFEGTEIGKSIPILNF